jgi:DNA invertase Pin-like site-specific DNA recombinase
LTLRAALYSRVSTEQQREGYSLDAQRRALHDACTARTYTIALETTDEGISARSERIEKRPGLTAALDAVKARQVDVLLVHSLDRLSRNVMVTLTVFRILADNHVAFVSLSEAISYDTPEGKLQLVILGAFASYFSDNLAHHVTKGKGERATQGKNNASTCALGYHRVDGVIVPDPDTAPLVKRLFAMAAEGCTLRQLRDESAAAGYLRHVSGFSPLLHNRLYLGQVQHHGVWYAGSHEPIVDPTIFALAEQSLASNRRTASHPPTYRAYLFGALLTCALCGEHYHAQTPQQRGPVYVCGGRWAGSACAQRGVGEARLIAQIPPLLARLAPPDDALRRIAGRPAGERSRPDVATVERQIERLRDTYVLGDTPRDVYLRERDRLRSLLEVREQSPAVDLAAVAAFMRDLPAHWQDADATERRHLLTSLFSDILMRDRTIVAVKPQPSVAPYVALLLPADTRDGYYLTTC